MNILKHKPNRAILIAIGLVTGSVVGLGWFYRNIKAASVTKTVEFYYDAGGQRVAKIDNSGDHVYYISPELEVVIKTDGSKVWRRNYYFAGRIVAVRENDGQ